MTSSTPEALWAARAVRVLRPAAVACHGLTRRAGGRLLLDRFSLALPVGARLLLVARPDASATLLLRILAGLSPPGGGGVELAGVADPARTGWSRRVAYVGPEPGLYPWISPREVLDLTAELHELPPDVAGRRIEAAVARYRLGEVMDRPIGRGGAELAQRVALASAMLADPEVLLLDEALRSVDPDLRVRLLRLPGRRTIVLASRYPSSEAGLCTHVALIRGGRLALHAPITRLGEHGLPLSLRGIEELADRLAASGSVGEAAQAGAVATS